MSRLAGRKIVIVGGGPVGLATAVHLGRQGLGSSTVVIERDATYSTYNDCDEFPPKYV